MIPPFISERKEEQEQRRHVELNGGASVGKDHGSAPPLHLVFGVRRAQRDGKNGCPAWIAAREEQWRGIVYSDVIIAAGFAIFVLSDFPPTQRFGLVVLAGCIIDILANLFVLPLLGGAPWRKK